MKIKSFLKYLWYIAPVIVILVSLLYFSFMYKNYQDRLVKLTYQEQVRFSNKVLTELDKLDSRMSELSRTESEMFMVSLIESIDAEYGTLARIFDIDGNLISKPQCNDLYEQHVVNLDIKQIYTWNSIQQSNSGEFEITVDDMKVILHWFAYPKQDTRYYIVIGVAPDKVSRAFNIDTFTYGLLGIIVLMLICTYYNLYLMNELRKYKDAE